MSKSPESLVQQLFRGAVEADEADQLEREIEARVEKQEREKEGKENKQTSTKKNRKAEKKSRSGKKDRGEKNEKGEAPDEEVLEEAKDEESETFFDSSESLDLKYKLAAILVFTLILYYGTYFLTDPARRRPWTYPVIYTSGVEASAQSGSFNFAGDQPPVLTGTHENGLRFRTGSPELSQYNQQFYRQGEFELNPIKLTTLANWWMDGTDYTTGEDVQACFGDAVDGTQMVIATWFYPCGSKVRVTNPVTGQTIIATVTDRGPHRNLQKEGWENDRIRMFGADITPAVANAVGQLVGETITIEPEMLSGENVQQSNQQYGPEINLLEVPENYLGFNSDGTFILRNAN